MKKIRFHFELADLLHPAQAFDHPSEVVNDADLTLNEKRAILASWASDASAAEAAPDLRLDIPGASVRFDEIAEALRSLDNEASGFSVGRVAIGRRSPSRCSSRGEGNEESPLH